MDNLIEALWNKLEILFSEYSELMDTDVREAIHLTLNYFFVWEKYRDKFPVSYCMFSGKGDRDVGEIIEEFIVSAKNEPDFPNILMGQERLNLLQNSNIKTANGLSYDDFIGHTDIPLPPDSIPEDLFDWDAYEYKD